jgi:hypothetical protein
VQKFEILARDRASFYLSRQIQAFQIFEDQMACGLKTQMRSGQRLCSSIFKMTNCVSALGKVV